MIILMKMSELPAFITISAVSYDIKVGGGFKRLSKRTTLYAKQLISNGTELLVFPEYLGFEMASKLREVEDIAEEASSYYENYLEFFKELSKSLKIYILAGTTPEPHGRYYYNTAHFFTPYGEVIKYRKIHLHKLDSEWGFKAGSEPVIISVKGVKLGLEVCYDLGFPELTKIYTLSGALGIIVPSMAPGFGAYMWLRYCAHARAIEMQGFSILATGNIRGLPEGFKFVTKPVILTTTDYTSNGIIAEDSKIAFGKLNITRLIEVRNKTAAPVIKDMRTDLHLKLCKLVQKLYKIHATKYR